MIVPFFGNIITAAAAVVCVLIANTLTSRQSARAKLWDLRRQAYSVILSELAAVERVCDVADSYMVEDQQRYFESDEWTAHIERSNAHMTTARQQFSDAYLILSEKFIACFLELASDLEGPPGEMSDDAHERFSAAIRKYRPLLLMLARKEVGEERGVWSYCRRVSLQLARSIQARFSRINFRRVGRFGKKA